VIFNIDYYLHKIIFRRTDINNWNTIYVEIFMQKYLIRSNLTARQHVHNYNSPTLLTKDWPCVMLADMYKASNRGQGYLMPERDVLKATFSFLSLINANNIRILNETEQLAHTMMAFLGKESTFLEEDIEALLSTFVKTAFANCSQFRLDDKFGDEQNFESLFIAALDQFQGASYGNRTFGVLILAPLAQRHDIKWRHMVWSEHIAVLRFITCEEKHLIGKLEDYLEPAETDKTLMKSYYQALHSNALIPGSLPHRIATHHVEAYIAELGRIVANAKSA